MVLINQISLKHSEDCVDSPTVLLAHQPKYIKDLENTDNIDLILCGHTHGGQFFPFNFLVKLEQPYVKGLNQHDENNSSLCKQRNRVLGTTNETRC